MYRINKSWLVLGFAMTLGLLAACSPSQEPLYPLVAPEAGPYALKGFAAPQPDQAAGTETPTQASIIFSGLIEIDPALKNQINDRMNQGPQTLFLIARSPEGGPPVAVKRMTVSHFPTNFRLDASNMMIPGTPVKGPLLLSARLDANGSAGPVTTGDFEGQIDRPLDPGTSGNRLLINKAY